MSRWPINKLRERALGNLMEHIHYEDVNTQYVCICAVNKVMSAKIKALLSSLSIYNYTKHRGIFPGLVLFLFLCSMIYIMDWCLVFVSIN
jgi:hypothetical protein